jgi:[ribosomal protein S5]-alanine N-acetyltransferase
MQIILASPSPDDAAEFIAAVEASRVLHRPWIDAPDTPQRYEAYLAHAALENHAAFLVRHASCNGIAGYVTVSNIVRGSFQSAYLGYGAFASHAGRGLMSEGIRAVIDVAFSELGLHRLEANIQPGNQRSLNLVQRLGFLREGFSPRYLRVDGAWRDHERWALRSEQWTADAPPR